MEECRGPSCGPSAYRNGTSSGCQRVSPNADKKTATFEMVCHATSVQSTKMYGESVGHRHVCLLFPTRLHRTYLSKSIGFAIDFFGSLKLDSVSTESAH